jgi:anti-sigma regulatory factor (Ser/Thr protein kinase)
MSPHEVQFSLGAAMNGTAERDETTAWSTRITGGATAPFAARELLTNRLGESVPADTLHNLLLLTTELVTNSVRHAAVDEAGTVELSVMSGPTLVRTSVIDPGGDTQPAVQDLDVNVPGGMGLFLVEQISTRWGVERMGDGATEVWFELAC